MGHASDHLDQFSRRSEPLSSQFDHRHHISQRSNPMCKSSSNNSEKISTSRQPDRFSEISKRSCGRHSRCSNPDPRVGRASDRLDCVSRCSDPLSWRSQYPDRIARRSDTAVRYSEQLEGRESRCTRSQYSDESCHSVPPQSNDDTVYSAAADRSNNEYVSSKL